MFLWMKKEICEYHFYVRTEEGPYGWQLSYMSSLIYGTVPGRAKLPPLLVNSVQVKITSSSQNLSANPSPCDHLLFCLLYDPLPCLDSSFGKLPFALFSLSCLLNGTVSQHLISLYYTQLLDYSSDLQIFHCLEICSYLKSVWILFSTS